MRGDFDAAAGDGRRRAEPALEIRGGGTEAGADAAERELVAGGDRSCVAELAIGREAAPGLVAAVEQVEADRARHDWDQRAADVKAAALFGEPGLHAAAGLEPEGRTAGQRDRIDASSVLAGRAARPRACPDRRRGHRSPPPPAGRTRSPSCPRRVLHHRRGRRGRRRYR